jgi:Flp pilus assembly protein TadD
LLAAGPGVAEPPAPSPQTASSADGLKALRAHDYPAANRDFSQGLSSDPRNPGLNGLNALAYDLRFRAGERDLFELAEIGYRTALEQRRDSLPIALQLARLYVADGRYEQAKRAALYALDLDPDNLDALQILGPSAYNAGDVEFAVWAVERARTLKAYAPSLTAMRPLAYAAAGLAADADQALSDGVASGAIDPARSHRIGLRLDQWRDLYQQTRLDTAATPPKPAPAALPAPVATAPLSTAPTAYAWWDCQQQLNASSASGASTGGASIDYNSNGAPPPPTAPLPALPAPCRAQPLPRMVMIDAVLLRADDTTSAGHGVNLLDGLSVFVSNSVSVLKTSGSAPLVRTDTLSKSIALGTSATAAGIAYSLNIANAGQERAEVLARPSLLALDRQPAQFFSGSDVTVALSGNAYSSGSLPDKSVGVSLSVTPTFIDDDTMLVSVKAVRSFFEPSNPSSNFAQSVQTARAMVTANVRLRFDQTLILSGLSEREVTDNDSRTPVVGRLPGLQYLFARRENRDFNRSVLILITPRRIQGLDDDLAPSHQPAASGPEPDLIADARLRARRDLAALRPNGAEALIQIDPGRLSQALRAGDVEAPRANLAEGFERLANDLAGLVYY